MSATQIGGRNSIEDSLIKKKAEECVQYIIFCYLADRKAIVRRSDLNKNVIKEYSKSFKDVFNLVEKYMKDVFGLILIDMSEDKDKYEKFGIRSKFKFDSDLNKRDNNLSKTLTRFSNESNSHESDKDFQLQVKYSMVMISLSLIFMNANEIEESLFFDSLKKLDINKEEKRHKYLGDVQKYFTSELVKEGYLEYEPIKGTEPPSFKLKWGYRAKLEITKRSVLNFVCQVYGDCKPQEWTAQFNDLKKTDGLFFDEVYGDGDTNGEADNDEESDEEEQMDITVVLRTQQQGVTQPSTSRATKMSARSTKGAKFSRKTQQEAFDLLFNN